MVARKLEFPGSTPAPTRARPVTAQRHRPQLQLHARVPREELQEDIRQGDHPARHQNTPRGIYLPLNYPLPLAALPVRFILPRK